MKRQGDSSTGTRTGIIMDWKPNMLEQLSMGYKGKNWKTSSITSPTKSGTTPNAKNERKSHFRPKTHASRIRGRDFLKAKWKVINLTQKNFIAMQYFYPDSSTLQLFIAFAQERPSHQNHDWWSNASSKQLAKSWEAILTCAQNARIQIMASGSLQRAQLDQPAK